MSRMATRGHKCCDMLLGGYQRQLKHLYKDDLYLGHLTKVFGKQFMPIFFLFSFSSYRCISTIRTSGLFDRPDTSVSPLHYAGPIRLFLVPFQEPTEKLNRDMYLEMAQWNQIHRKRSNKLLCFFHFDLFLICCSGRRFGMISDATRCRNRISVGVL